MAAVPVHQAKAELLLAKQNAEGGHRRLPLREVPATGGHKQDIMTLHARGRASVAKLALQHNFQTREIDLIRQFRCRAGAAGKVNFLQFSRIID